jgi:hypothetical protein
MIALARCTSPGRCSPSAAPACGWRGVCRRVSIRPSGCNTRPSLITPEFLWRTRRWLPRPSGCKPRRPSLPSTCPASAGLFFGGNPSGEAPPVRPNNGCNSNVQIGSRARRVQKRTFTPLATESMDEIRVIGDAETLRSLERLITNKHGSLVQFRTLPMQAPEGGLEAGGRDRGQAAYGADLPVPESAARLA